MGRNPIELLHFGISFIKSRAQETIVDCSVIANLESPDSYSIDHQTGGKLSILNSVIEQSERTENAIMVGVNSVSFNSSIPNELVLKGNVFLNDANRGVMVNYFKQSPTVVTIENNRFIGSSTILNFTSSLPPSNEVSPSRPASIGSYPSLPSTGSCLTPAF